MHENPHVHSACINQRVAFVSPVADFELLAPRSGGSAVRCRRCARACLPQMSCSAWRRVWLDALTLCLHDSQSSLM